MEKIASFSIDHLRLKPGLYVSRKDVFAGTTITTFDIRFKEPNMEPVIDMPALHTIEHLAATFIRSQEKWAQRVVYLGPMGCRTGFYLIVHGDLDSHDVLPLLQETLAFVETFDGQIPGAAASECGNWREHNLEMAKWECRRYAAILKNPKKENLNYPD